MKASTFNNGTEFLGNQYDDDVGVGSSKIVKHRMRIQ